ncbi:CobW family GTP-binding protein [Paraburkholderia caballeronis]|uniref:GTPase, G3E family n=1 Tax=Paraburkholderia caballeronis TaxID=416943 RepID=A0A1H7HF37_9BURK|nr:GTP-binding protein [Paraburkholderia caballeronis]PXW29534.1 G3E family GTPase [Paraburkholderia caballeronis]PXX04793.1 G3E family GTPase [Paraburkholderia caballeronis]RAK05854.1 G3E family GTPase [Paraburkholderia caballeronis]TDV18634.1 G3E family GTPase [Paraburkholderia caballeronis]TDV19828.1 G3E family GTPase [Paraburkholderia caballeronis]
MIPVTILTGFLGSGKTTLLKRILNEQHGMKIAVIENEFGEENIDNEILVQDSNEQIIQMSNGCICCTIRGDLARVLGDLASRKRAGEFDFDRVVIETTGLANPGPVAQTFFMDNEIADEFLLDAIITLVDAKHGNHQLDEHEVVQRQVGFADRLFITKADLVDEKELEDLRHRLLHMNPKAQIRVVNFGEANIKEVFDLRGFNLNAKLEIDPDFLAEDEHDHAHHGHDHDHDHANCDHDHGHCDHEGHDHGHHHHHHAHHDDKIKSFVYRSDRPFDPNRLEDFLGGILQIYGERLLRYKGVLYMKGVDRKVVFQGVHQMMGSDLAAKWLPVEKKNSKMVFIGIELPQDLITDGLDACLA